MMKGKILAVKKCAPFELEISDIAPDKSISHRCAIFSLLSDKSSRIKNFLKAEDTLHSLSIAEALGAKARWEKQDDGEVLHIDPPSKLCEPAEILECGNSGTTIRLISGFLAGVDGFFVLTGDEYLKRRPMRRVADPLRQMGAKIDGRDGGNLAPLAIRGGKLSAIEYESRISSAQVKSAMILAALNADGKTVFSEPELSRDHTERMLTGMGAPIEVGERIVVRPLTAPLKPLDLTVPADPSSGFFFAVAAAIVPGAKVVLKNITLNPTRTEAYKVLKQMGAKIEFALKSDIYEPIGDITVEHAPLKGVELSENISWLIDEIPALSIAMAAAVGKSRITNAKELRVKESDRIKSVVVNLQKCGISVVELEDGMEIAGGEFGYAEIDSFGDHRIAMSFAIAGLLSGMKVDKFDSVATSFPNFTDILSQISETELS